MKKRSNRTQLQDAIQLLEAEQAYQLQLMKSNLHHAYESVQPAKLIQNTLKQISVSPYLVNNLVSAAVGLAAGYVTKTAITAGSKSKFKRLLGIFLQFGITNLIAQNPRAVKTFGQYVSRQISHKEE